MKKIAVIFVLAVLLPSLVLAWLAVRSLRDQQFLLERQQSLLCQRVTDSIAEDISARLAQQQQAFGVQVESLVAGKSASEVGAQFDDQIRQSWPLAEVGFCVTRSGKILSPITASTRKEAQAFVTDNTRFLANREAVEIYGSFNNANVTANGSSSMGRNSQSPSANAYGSTRNFSSSAAPKQSDTSSAKTLSLAAAPAQKDTLAFSDAAAKKDSAGQSAQNGLNYKTAQSRAVNPQSQSSQVEAQSKSANVPAEQNLNLSRVVPAEAEFAQFIGDENDGLLARFLQNKLKLMFWHRLNREPDFIFGAQLNLNRVVEGLRDLVQPGSELQNEICLVLLDDNAKPVVISRANYSANWKHPFVATEIGEALPHWEIAAYLVNPASLTQAAETAKLTLSLLIAVLVLAIGVGSWLIVRSLNAELTLARQKTDFVSNVSHELKTPLTSIRMFSELLAEGRVSDVAKQRSYLNIITAEAARLTRLINNVLDFSRMESGEKKYNFQPCDLTEVVRATAETFRPHLEANGFTFECELSSALISVRGDADALSQILVNLLSNAEKYSNGGVSSPSPLGGERVGVRGDEESKTTRIPENKKQIVIQLTQKQSPLPHAEIRVLDRGTGVPRGSEEKVFEKFYRAHDSLSSGIQGSGLGLTIARQIARAHGGDVVCEPRDGGGSCFVLRLPISTTDKHG